MSTFTHAVCCLVMIVGFVPLASADDPPAREPLLTNGPAVVSMLRKEARTWTRDKTFPREQADFAQDRNLTLPDDEIIALLQKDLHRDSAIDAYIKWQLLSFEPDLSTLTPEQSSRILRSLPEFKRMPGPKDNTNQFAAAALARRKAERSSQSDPMVGAGNVNTRGLRNTAFDPTISVVNEGVILDTEATVNPSDPRYVTITARPSQTDVVSLDTIPVFGAANAVAGGARADIINAMPRQGGVQLVAMFNDLRERIEAGDDSTHQRAQTLERTVRDYTQEHDLPDALRAMLLDWNATLLLMATPVYDVEPIDGTLSDKVNVRWVRMPQAFAERIDRHLRAKPPAQGATEATQPAP